MINTFIIRYKNRRNLQQLQQCYKKKYAFVGIGSHSLNNLFPVLDYLHIPLKYICCQSAKKLPFIERKWKGVCATTSLQDILSDKEIEGVFVSAAPSAHFAIAQQVLASGKSLWIEKPPCQSAEELQQLIEQEKTSTSPVVMVGMQKRYAPATTILQHQLKKDTPYTYYIKYQTGTYPEGDALSDLFIHPLDYVCHLFGKAILKGCECISNNDGMSVLLMLKHPSVTGIAELSTAHSWTNAQEALTIHTKGGTYELTQMEELKFMPHSGHLFGIPLDKIFHHNPVTISLFSRNNFVPTFANHQTYTQGYFNELKAFADAVEKSAPSPFPCGFQSMHNTYTLLKAISDCQ